MVALKPLLLLLALGAEALAGPVKPASCTTILGTKTVKNVPTSTTTAIKKINIIKKVIRKINVVVVPVAKTTTIRTTHVATVTSVDQKTDTAWVTLTSPSTSWITRTVVTVSTTVSPTYTTKDVTITFPRPAGFTPIGDSDWPAVPTFNKRDIRTQTILPDDQQPQSVRCVVDKPQYSTKTVSTTVQGPRRTLKAVTKTKISTISTTVTKTEYPPNVKTTLTTVTWPVTTLVTDTSSTLIITETVTVESQVPRATVYDICQDDNILNGANNGYFAGYIYEDNVVTQYINGIQTAKQCCQACAAVPSCKASLFSLSSSQPECTIFTAIDPDVCANNAQPKFGFYQTNPDQQWDLKWHLSNGGCGHWENGGEWEP
ncbi:uncharacterized protein B0J16DRAFT_47775 [Fusarium flagelliforme]|uniref:uncharacterized protein n=1 Tax=Fusarium flagelliforme TaxID=2675880 RepID=UPI001E8D2B3C|nr:uncharacterized protein B0J16DRAFT_47775 [Fusarium flagelliforme]KAH7198969.1 hypothetical protein B0J16DRAFT_47775 [Fusarium flagelliforme]